MTSAAHVPWRALLLGGSSGVGKTTVAQQLARHYGISLVLVDDVRLALQHTTTPEQFPVLHYFVSTPSVWQRSPEQLRDGLIGIGRALVPALAIIIAHHVAVEGAGPLILEGDGIVPELIAWTQAHHFQAHGLSTRLPDVVRAVFLVEEDEQAILQNMQERDRGMHKLPAEEQRAIARASWLYGHWLRQEAATHVLPAIPARPWETLFPRVRQLLTP